MSRWLAKFKKRFTFHRRVLRRGEKMFCRPDGVKRTFDDRTLSLTNRTGTRLRRLSIGRPAFQPTKHLWDRMAKLAEDF